MKINENILLTAICIKKIPTEEIALYGYEIVPIRIKNIIHTENNERSE